MSQWDLPRGLKTKILKSECATLNRGAATNRENIISQR